METKTLWEHLCEDPRFQNLPYKIELNRLGQIIMSPASNRHGNLQAKIAHLLATLMPGGEIATELAVQTADSVKTADVAWATDERWAKIGDESSASIAPEICVEVKSPSNSRSEIAAKGRLYLDAGALEFWNCDKDGQITFFDTNGPLTFSRLCPQFPTKLQGRVR